MWRTSFFSDYDVLARSQESVMNQQDRIEFFKTQLEIAKRDFPSNSEEVRVANVNYERALRDRTEEGDTRTRS
jgi:hypothetical protein